MDEAVDYVKLMDYSILQYKFAVGIRNYFVLEKNKPQICVYPEVWSYYKHRVTKDDLVLTSKDENTASMLVEHISLYIMVGQLDSILQSKLKDRFNHPDCNIRSLSIITRLIRNAFAHNPFYPVWKIDRINRNQIYEVKDTIKLDTTGLKNKPMKREDYGGPLAILSMAKYGLKLIKSYEGI